MAAPDPDLPGQLEAYRVRLTWRCQSAVHQKAAASLRGYMQELRLLPSAGNQLQHTDFALHDKQLTVLKAARSTLTWPSADKRVVCSASMSNPWRNAWHDGCVMTLRSLLQGMKANCKYQSLLPATLSEQELAMILKAQEVRSLLNEDPSPWFAVKVGKPSEVRTMLRHNEEDGIHPIFLHDPDSEEPNEFYVWCNLTTHRSASSQESSTWQPASSGIQR